MSKLLSAILLFFVAALSGCSVNFLRPHQVVYTDGSMGYKAGYRAGAGLLIGIKHAPVIPQDNLRRMSKELDRYAYEAETQPGWYTCGNWVYNPEGNPTYPKEFHRYCTVEPAYSRVPSQCSYAIQIKPTPSQYDFALNMPLPTDPCRELAYYKSEHDLRMEKLKKSRTSDDVRRW